MFNKKALIIGDGWVANNRHKPVLKMLGIDYKVYDPKYVVDETIGVEFDFALICTPPQSRVTALRMCIDKGISQIFIEKPIANSVEDAREILKLKEDNKLKIRSCHNFIFSNVGRCILQQDRFQMVNFFQLNRSDRVLPKWVYELNYGIGLDEFAHMGYLARSISPEKGLLDDGINYFENDKSSINKWVIQLINENGEYHLDLWRDSVYFNKAKSQKKYWQYIEEWSEIGQRFKSLLNVAFNRLIFRKSNDFGTKLMWEKFLSNSLNEKEEKLTSIEMSEKILLDFLEYKKNECVTR